MSPQEYRDALETLGLSQRKAAELLGVNEKTSRDWADLRKPPVEPGSPHRRAPGPPGPAAHFLRYMIAAGVSADQVFRTLGMEP
jgi:hypothetical protein